jgi:hypothetical protein
MVPITTRIEFPHAFHAYYGLNASNVPKPILYVGYDSLKCEYNINYTQKKKKKKKKIK